jgi:hypothetical protein
MNPDFGVALGWIGCAIAVCSYLGVHSWVEARRREREAYYRSEAIKKVAEMQGTASEPILALLREALKPAASPPSAAWMGPAQAKAYYKSETLKRIAELKGPDADAVLAAMREDEARAFRRAREGMKLGGLILVATGTALLFFLKVMVPDMPVYLSGLIPMLVGVALLAYALLFARNE